MTVTVDRETGAALWTKYPSSQWAYAGEGHFPWLIQGIVNRASKLGATVIVRQGWTWVFLKPKAKRG